MLTIGQFLSYLVSNPIYIIIMVAYSPIGYLIGRLVSSRRLHWLVEALIFVTFAGAVPIAMSHLLETVLGTVRVVVDTTMLVGFCIGYTIGLVRGSRKRVAY